MNLNETQQRIRWLTFGILAGAAILLTILDSTGNLRQAFDFLRDPMTVILEWTSARTDTIAGAIAGPRDLQAAQAEITQLQARIDELERENEELREIQGEHQILLDLFNRARQAPDLSRVTAAVIGRDPSPLGRSIIINKGGADGVQVGMAVEGARGLVGRVVQATARSAQIILITDNSSAVPVRLGNSRATGILRGGGLGGAMSIDWIDLKNQLAVGEVVLTSGLGSGLGQNFPGDIVIGRVIEVERREAELFQRAIVQPAVDFDSLEIVFIITDFEPINIDIFADPAGN